MLFFLDNVEPYSDGTPSGKISNKENKQPYSIARSGEYMRYAHMICSYLMLTN